MENESLLIDMLADLGFEPVYFCNVSAAATPSGENARMIFERMHGCSCRLEFMKNNCAGCIFVMDLECDFFKEGNAIQCSIVFHIHSPHGNPVFLSSFEQTVCDRHDVNVIRECILNIVWKYEDAFEIKCLSDRMKRYDSLRLEMPC